MKIVFPYDGYESLGIGYLASVAIQNGHKAILAPIALGDYIRGYSHQNTKKIDKAKNAILQLKPDIVAFSLNSIMAAPMIKVAKSIRLSGIKSIAGGPHCSAEPVKTIESGAFDAVIAGEAENVFNIGIENVYRDNFDLPWLFTTENKDAEYGFTDDINIIPFPSKELFYQINRYESDDYKIISSRGCPYNCVFCSHSNPKVNSIFRRRSIENLINELIQAKRNYSIKSVYFLDDVFTINGDWLRDFMKTYKQKINLPFHAISHPHNINSDIISFLKEGGCFAMRLGVQTTTEKTKSIIGRPIDNKKVRDAINNLRGKGIKVEIDHMVNLPGESLSEARESIKFYNDNRPDAIKVYWLMPLPGTLWFKQSEALGLITKEQAVNIRNGMAFGRHSYLFYNKLFNNSDWLGIHFMLSYLPLLPKMLVSLLIKLKADRFLRIRSFSVIVGIPRFINLFGSWDKVSRDHIKRIYYSVSSRFKTY